MAEAAPRASYAEYLALEAESKEKHEYVDGLISQTEPRVEFFHHTDAGWVLTEAGPGEALYLASLEGSLDVDALYADALS